MNNILKIPCLKLSNGMPIPALGFGTFKVTNSLIFRLF